MAAAQSGGLLTDAGLSAQVPRMLADARATTLVTSFAEQWMNADNFASTTPDPTAYPRFNADVRQSMQNETQAFLSDFVVRGAPLGQMLTANYSYLDDTLATYYGLPTPNSRTPVRVVLPASSGRMGLLSQGTMLVAGSTGAAGSAVKRGHVVLSRVLCQPMGAPPNGVSLATPSDANGGPMTQRQALAQHVANPQCAACHVDMDALGFAFGKFSGSGEQRASDNNLPIDASGTFDNVPFEDNLELMPVLSQDARFGACATAMLFVYGLGRPTTEADTPTLTGLTTLWAANRQSLPLLIQQVVLSQAFRSRHG